MKSDDPKIVLKKSEYNLNFLIKIKRNGFIKSNRFKYQTERNFLGITLRKEGYTEYEIYVRNELPFEYVDKNHIIYLKPHCTLYFPSDISYTKYFDTIEEMNKFADDIGQRSGLNNNKVVYKNY